MVIRVGFPNKRRFMVTGYYRRWSNVYNNKKCEHLSYAQQNENFENQMKIISENNSEMEKILMGDINVDYRIFNKSESEKIAYEKGFSSMLKSIETNLLSNGFSQIISESTRNNKILDHIYVNKLNQVHKSYIDVDSPSDHNFISIEKKMLYKPDEETYIITRNWNNVNYEEINEFFFK